VLEFNAERSYVGKSYCSIMVPSEIGFYRPKTVAAGPMLIGVYVGPRAVV
jgi:hypothetical protein